MKTKIITRLIGLTFPFLGFGQYYSQYFDGADTLCESNLSSRALCVTIDSGSTNIWQIGLPQKMIFDSAATYPNAIVTDTVNYYPVNNTSSFQYTIDPSTNWGILAIQWKQKLDTDYGFDGGVVEFSVDSGNTWENAFNNPYVYNFYGYDTSNVDTIQNGTMVFTGTDSTWKNIWLCYDMAWLNWNHGILVRHTFLSDSIDNNKEGWLIDNMLAHITLIHTVNEIEQQEYMIISPNPTTGRVNITTKKIDEPHIIEKMELINIEGKIVQQWSVSPTKFYVDIGNHPNGIYFLNIKTNIQSETFKIVLEH